MPWPPKGGTLEPSEPETPLGDRMAARACPVLTRRLRAFSRAVGLGIALDAGLLLVAWQAFPHQVPRLFLAANPLTVLSLLAAGLSLFLGQGASASSARLARACALVPVAFGLLWPFVMGIARRPDLAARFPAPPLQTSISLFLLGLALLVLDASPRRPRSPSNALALAGLLLPYLALIGYTFHLGREHLPYSPSPHMAMVLLLLAVGILCARPERGTMALLTSDSLGGTVFRRLAPGALGAPLLLGWLSHGAERAGLYGPELGDALISLTMGFVGLGLVLWNVDMLNRTEADRERAEEALKGSEERYRRLIELSPEAVFVARGGRILFANPAGATLVGARDAGEVIGRSLIDFVHPDSRALTRVKIACIQSEHQTAVTFEKRMVRMDGSTVDVESTVGPLRYGEEEAMLALSRDISERKKAIEEIAMRTAELKKATELDRLKDHFLSTLSHEMKTPLSLIVGYSELLEEKYPEEELLKGVQDGARRLTEHIDSMLDYSALLSGTLPLYKTEVYLGELVEAASQITAAGRAAHGQRLETRLEPSTPPVSADQRRVTQILVELLDNASKFTRPGGTVGIHIRPVDGEVRLEVWDTGPGIPPEAVQQIFEPFAQLAIGNTGRRGGLGLGLTIARKLAELHGGTLEVTSDPGKGSRFTVKLPIDSAQ